MEKKEDFINEAIIADILVRLTALEITLKNTGLIDEEQLANKYKELAELLAKSILKNANISGDLNQMSKDFIKNN